MVSLSSSNVDSAENLSRWRAMMTGGSQSPIDTISSATSSVPTVALTALRPGGSEPTTAASQVSRGRVESLNDDQSRTAMHNVMQASLGPTCTSRSASPVLVESGDDTGWSVPHRSKSTDIPSVVLSSEHTPAQSPGSTSPSSHPHPSPAISGLRAPVNSPQVHASSPQFAPGNTHDEDVGAALAWFVQNLEGGRSLNESMWAPKNGKYTPSPLRGSRVPSGSVTPPVGAASRASSRDLTSVNVVQPNPAINDNFSRMSFRAADSDRRVSNNIIGERNVRPSTASRAMSSGTSPIQNIFASLENPAHDDRFQPLSSTSAVLTQSASSSSPVLAQTAATNIVPDGIIVTDFAERKENISSSAPKTAWVPPHLRDKAKAPEPSAQSDIEPLVGVMQSSKEGLTKIVEASSGDPATSPQTTEPQSSTPVGSAGKDSIIAATEVSPSLAEIGQNLLKSIVDLESNGYLSAEMIASLYAVHRTIQAQLGDTAEESTGEFCLPAKTYKDPSRPIQEHLVTTTSGAKTDDQSTKKEKVQTALTIQTDDPYAMVPESESSTPASGYSSTGLGPANFRKILAATSASTANSPVAPPSTPAREKLASVSASKASASAPITPDRAKLTPTYPDKLPSKAVSTTPAAASKVANTATDAKDTEDRQDQTWFSSWGKREERDRPSAKIRTVILTGLPYNATSNFVASLVYGGIVEYIQMRSSADGTLTASVRFMDADACKRYYNDTSNGIVYKKDIQNRESVAFVELAKDVDVVGGMLQQWIDNGVTRCVRAVGVDEERGMEGLTKMAERKGRKLEGISDSKNPGGARSVVFRFCKVEDAVQFKSALVRDQDWEHCNVHFAVDPCTTATGVHFND